MFPPEVYKKLTQSRQQTNKISNLKKKRTEKKQNVKQ